MIELGRHYNHEVHGFYTCSLLYKNKPTLEKVADFLLTPLRYLKDGPTMAIRKHRHFGSTDIYTSDIYKHKKSWQRTALAIITFIPGTIIGVILKSCCHGISKTSFGYKEMRDNYRGLFGKGRNYWEHIPNHHNANGMHGFCDD